VQGTIRVGHRQHFSGLGFIRSGLVGNYAAGATKLDRFGRTRPAAMKAFHYLQAIA
jgi:hypothetical protein